jgi:hypothetical protein
MTRIFDLCRWLLTYRPKNNDFAARVAGLEPAYGI